MTARLRFDGLDVLEEDDLVVELDVRAVRGILRGRLPETLPEDLRPDAFGDLARRGVLEIVHSRGC